MLSLRIALRYLFSRKSHSAVNIISAISMAGVAVATIATVCVMSVFNGFSDLATARLSRVDPDLRIERNDGRILSGADSLAGLLRSVEGVRIAVPTLTGRALCTFSGSQLPVRVKGVDSGYSTLTKIDSLVIDGEFVDADDTFDNISGQTTPYANLSIGVAVQLQNQAPQGVYDYLTIYAPRRTARINPANPLGAFAADTAVIASVFAVDQPEWDTDLVILPIATVRHLFEYTDSDASAIEIGIAPDADVATVKTAVRQILPEGIVALDRMEQQQASHHMIAVEKWITFMLLAFILIIASFNLISTLSILIIDKTRNILTLSALGASPSTISRIFMLQGWLISLGGGVAGLVIGAALCIAQQTWGFIRLAGDATRLTITAYPVRLELTDLVIVLALVAAVGLLSTLITRRFIRSRLGNLN